MDYSVVQLGSMKKLMAIHVPQKCLLTYA